jgi:hypothetical protein
LRHPAGELVRQRDAPAREIDPTIAAPTRASNRLSTLPTPDIQRTHTAVIAARAQPFGGKNAGRELGYETTSSVGVSIYFAPE